MTVRQTVLEAKRYGVLDCRPQQTLSEAASRMIAEDVSALVAVDSHGCLAGILSRLDLLRALVGSPDWEQELVQDWMVPDVVTVAPDLSLRSAAELFAARHLGGAPVMAGSRVVGVISTSDILAFEASTPDAAAAMRERAEWERGPSEEWREGNDPPSAFFTDLWMDDDMSSGRGFIISW